MNFTADLTNTTTISLHFARISVSLFQPVPPSNIGPVVGGTLGALVGFAILATVGLIFGKRYLKKRYETKARKR